MNSPHVEADLVAYLDGELNAIERARVDAHLARCSACAAQLEELRDLQHELDATLDAALAPERLSYAADQKIREHLRARLERPRWWWLLWPRRGLLAQAVMALLLVVFSFNAYQVFQVPVPPAPHETLVLGYERLAPGTQAALRVIVRNAESTLPLAGAEVLVSLVRAPGVIQQVYAGLTNPQGTAAVNFNVPEDLSGEATLVVETRSSAGETQISRPVTIARTYKIYLGSDKPAYRPGQTVHMRALVLDAATLHPSAGEEMTFEVYDAQGNKIAHHARRLSEYGVAAVDVQLPDIAAGMYSLRAILGDTVSERTILVDDYELPAFRVTFETDRGFYAPGDRVQVTGEAGYFFGKAVAKGIATVRVYADEAGQAPLVETTSETDEEGRFSFVFDLPEDVGREADTVLSLEVAVSANTGQQAGFRKQLLVAAKPLVIKAVPESGVLKPRVPNVVYVMTAYPDGTPAETTLTLKVNGETYHTRSDAYGLAEFRFRPALDTATLDVQATTASGVTAQTTLHLASDASAEVLLLRTERATYAVGDTLRMEALLSGAATTVYLDVIHAQQTAAVLSAPVEEGRAVFALDLGPSLVGALELHAYVVDGDGLVVEDTRWVVVEMPQQLQVDVSSDRARYLPGDIAHIHVETSLAGQPVPSVLGLAVVDESVYALDTLPPSFTRAYFLLEHALLARRGSVPGLDLPALLDAEAPVRDAQDMAARAAWAGASGDDFSLHARARSQPPDHATQAMRVLAKRLVLFLSGLPLLMTVVIMYGLVQARILGKTLRRLGLGLLGLTLLSPLLIAASMLGTLLPALGGMLLGITLLAVLSLLLALFIYSWRRRDVRVQFVTGLLAMYFVLGGALIALSARGIDPAAQGLTFLVGTFLLLIAALAVLGQGLVLEGRRIGGWLATLLALALVILAVALPSVPALNSRLTRTLGNPALYSGPLGWLTGCSVAAPTRAPEAAEMTVEKEKPIEKTAEVEAEVPDPTQAPATAPTPTAVPTATPAEPLPQPTPTLPVAPYPLRHIFPETLYWAPEALTNDAGTLDLELPLAETLTSWRLTALASTLEGDLGAATYNFVVSQ